jgi:hypothetical protein
MLDMTARHLLVFVAAILALLSYFGVPTLGVSVIVLCIAVYI